MWTYSLNQDPIDLRLQTSKASGRYTLSEVITERFVETGAMTHGSSSAALPVPRDPQKTQTCVILRR